jgi:hypothetical protein
VSALLRADPCARLLYPIGEIRVVNTPRKMTVSPGSSLGVGWGEDRGRGADSSEASTIDQRARERGAPSIQRQRAERLASVPARKPNLFFPALYPRLPP